MIGCLVWQVTHAVPFDYFRFTVGGGAQVRRSSLRSHRTPRAARSRAPRRHPCLQVRTYAPSPFASRAPQHRQLFRDAGLHIEETATAGGAHLTSAYLLGFSSGDVPEELLRETLLIPTTEQQMASIASGKAKDAAQRRLYFGSYLVARAPKIGSSTHVWIRQPLDKALNGSA